MSYYIACLIVFIMLALIWSTEGALNFTIKLGFIGMAVWSGMRLFLSKGP